MSGTQPKQSRADVLARVVALITGLQQRFPSGSFTIGSVAYATPALVQVLQGLADALTGLAAARASAKDALAKAKAEAASVRPIQSGLVKQLESMFAGATQTLAEFGIEPPKARKPLSSEALAARKAKAAATRKARGTRSAKAKQAVVGNVTGVEITPVTAPPTPPSPPQQASSSPTTPVAAK